MRKIDNIVVSNVEPKTNSLWIEGSKLRYFGSNGWTPVGTGIGILTDRDGVILNDLKRNKAEDQWALATGESTYAYGYASSTFNENTVAYNDGESAFGIWNKSNDGKDEISQTLHSVGFGTGETPANAWEIMRNGDIYVNGIGGYTGANATSLDSRTLQDVINSATGGATVNLPLFNATELFNSYTTKTPITEEFKNALVKAVKDSDIIYITKDNYNGLSFKVMIVFAGYTKDEIYFTASDNTAHYKIILDLNTNAVTLMITDIIKNYAFNISNTPEAKTNNLELIEKIGLDEVVTVKVEGTQGKNTYDTLGVYNKGSITALEHGHQVLFDIHFDTGEVTILSDMDVTKALPCITLQVGNSDEIKAMNLEMLPQGTFFACLDYGYGVGSFQAATGGFVHTTTAKGNEVFYDIKADGTIEKNDTYVKPNEPYTLRLEADRINKQLTDIEASALKKAGEIVVITTSGPVTYTRTIDSTNNMLYFTDSKKNGETILLTYNDTNKYLSSAPVPAIPATQTTYGGVKQGVAIQDASLSDAVDKFNQLLATLRDAGVIAR